MSVTGMGGRSAGTDLILTPTSSPLHKHIADAATEVVGGTRLRQASQEKPWFLRLRLERGRCSLVGFYHL